MNDSNEPPEGSEAHEFGLLCGLCRTRMYATPDQIGQTIQCPDCFSDHTVTAADERRYNATRFRANKPASPLDQSLASSANKSEEGNDEDEYQLAPMDDTPAVQAAATPSAPPAAKDGEYIRVPCPICNWVYVGKPESVGQSTTCADCHNVFKIKPRAVAKKVQRVVAYDPKIGVAAASELPEQEGRSEELMAKAHAHREEIEKDKPQPPKRPFTEGIYNYPFMSRVIQAWLALPLLLFLPSIMISYSLTTQDKEQMVGLLVMVGVFPLLVTALVYAGFHMMQLLMTTANGYRQPVEWPRFDFGEWAGHLLFFVFSISVALMPGAILGIGLPWYGKWAAHAISGFLFHPFVLLSMMDANSPVMPYTRQIHRTVTKAPAAWMKFYLALLPVALALVFTIVLTVLARKWLVLGTVMFGVLTIVFSLGMTIYFRLLGRLAWVLGDVPTEEEEKERKREIDEALKDA